MSMSIFKTSFKTFANFAYFIYFGDTFIYRSLCDSEKDKYEFIFFEKKNNVNKFLKSTINFKYILYCIEYIIEVI